MRCPRHGRRNKYNRPFLKSLVLLLLLLSGAFTVCTPASLLRKFACGLLAGYSGVVAGAKGSLASSFRDFTFHFSGPRSSLLTLIRLVENDM